MPRTFKLSFPLPRRKSSSDKQPGPSPQRMYSGDADDFPMYSPSVKADELLGTRTAEHNNLDLLEQPPRRPKRLRKNPSFISVTISDAGSGSVKDTDDGLMSSNSVSGDRSSRRPSFARNQPSSPLLGHSFPTAVERQHNSPDFSVPGAYHTSSSSTSRSYYDAAKPPPLISQTSAYSARDMALRKGYPPVSSPLARDAAEAGSPGWSHHDLEKGDPSFQTRKPCHMEPSTLLPELKPFDPPVHSPHLFSKSPTPPSFLARTHRSISDRTKWLGRERWKPKQPDPSLYHTSQSRSWRDDQTGIASDMPIAEKPGRNWFDVIEARPSARKNPSQAESGIATPRQLAHSSKDLAGTSRHSVLCELPLRSRKSSRGNNSECSTATQLRTGQGKDSNSRPLHSDRSSSEPYEIRSTPSVRSQRSKLSGHSNQNTLNGLDLRNQSVLALSSSEDESEENVPSKRKVQRHRIRESIDYADKGEEALVLSAERIKPIKPQPVINVRLRRRSRSSGSEVVPPVPTIPARPLVSPRVSSMKWQEHTNIKVALDSHGNGADSDRELSTTGSRTSRSSMTSFQRKPNQREHRMMAVTADEEKLLEGMRRRRASLRRDTMIDGSARHGPNHHSIRDSILARPKTAGEDRQSRYLEAHISETPPSVSDDLEKSLRGSFAASADDLTREIEYFPEVPELPIRLRKPHFESSPKNPPSLSFTGSDLVPSTPTSRRSPITPPPGLGHLDVSSGATASPARSVQLPKAKHERKRTVSSSVVILDGAEQRARQLDEEDEITGWAMDRW